MCGTIFQQRWKDNNADIRSTLKGLTLMQTGSCFYQSNSVCAYLQFQFHLSMKTNSCVMRRPVVLKKGVISMIFMRILVAICIRQYQV